MKQKHLKRALSLALVLALAAPMLPAVSSAAQAEENFNRELSKLIQAEDTSTYFDSMEMTIGSNVLTVDGRTETLDAAPDIKGDRTMLPIRAVAENAGAEVGYESASKTVVITNDYGDEIRCPVGESTMTVNNSTCDLDVAAYIDESSGRTYLPVRAVAEALNLEVGWDRATSTVTLTAPYQTSRVLAWADQLDTSTLGAEKVIHDGTGLWVLQFSSPSEAKDAAETLNGMGITAEPDCVIPFEEPDTDGTAAPDAQSHYTWGAVNCKFDEFVSTYSSQFKGTGVVAVVDTGVDSNHPFLKGKMLSGWNCVDGNSNSSDMQYHGTHVAATIVDCAGTAPVKILPVRVFTLIDGKVRAYNTTVAAGIKYAANHGADVINLSLGGGHSSIQDEAIAYAVNQGTLVVAAAGNENDNTTNHCPAHITSSGVVVVSAGDSKRQKASFSNYGNSVDLMAPGVSIKAAVPGGQYKSLNGTSMAAPHAAAAAVLLDLATGKSLTPAALEQKVRSATTNKGVWKNQQMGCGFLDLSQADISKPEASVTVTPGTPSVTDTSVKLSVTCAFANTKPTAVRLYLGKSSSSLSQEKSNSVSPSGASLSTSFTLDTASLDSGTVYYYQFGVVTGDGEYKSTARSFTTPEKKADNVTLTLKDPTDFTETNIRLNVSCTYEGAVPDTMKLYMGESSSRMQEKNSSSISPTRSPFNYYLGLNLSNTAPGKTYYYQFVTTAGGKEYKSSIGSFTTKGAEKLPAEIKFTIDIATVGNSTVTLQMSGSYANTTPTEARLYLGTSSGSLRLEQTGAVSLRGLFDYKFKLDTAALQGGTTYYYQYAVIADGQEYRDIIRSFTTPSSTPPQATGPASTAYAVGTDGYLAINDQPAVSPGWSKQLGRVKEGSSCTVYTSSKSGSWYFVSCDGVYGWAHENYLTFNTRTGVVHDAGWLAINDKAAVSPKWSKEIGAIPDGAACRVYPDKSSGSWYYVTYNGITGYAHSKYITLQ